MSLTVVSFGAAVRIGGEYDGDGQRGFVLLAAMPSPALLLHRCSKRDPFRMPGVIHAVDLRTAGAGQG